MRRLKVLAGANISTQLKSCVKDLQQALPLFQTMCAMPPALDKAMKNTGLDLSSSGLDFEHYHNWILASEMQITAVYKSRKKFVSTDELDAHLSQLSSNIKRAGFSINDTISAEMDEVEIGFKGLYGMLHMWYVKRDNKISKLMIELTINRNFN